MEYGCIGERLSHSFSREIHKALADYEYILREVPREELDSFMKNADFKAINVTIPYKELVIPYLYFIDSVAESIHAVNTVVNRDGRLYGYNTDSYGMKSMIEYAGIDFKDRKVAILGTGGTSKTAFAVATSLGAKVIFKVSRSVSDGAVTYGDLYENHSDTEIIINTTPSGMYPNIFDTPVDLSHFERLVGVVDAVYNPLRSRLVLSALKMGVKATGGLYMLLAQGKRASEIFTDNVYGEEALNSLYSGILRQKENIVLIGMPSSGKSTVGRLLAKRLCRDFYDTDEIIEKREGRPISDIFKNEGEKHFRELESAVIRELSTKNGVIIATGGGAVLREDNTLALKMNGRLYFIDRPLSRLFPSGDRPLTSTIEALKKKYDERYPIYNDAMDVRIDADCSDETVADRIEENFNL